MTAESTQGDNHDKAWKKVEKQFRGYVETSFFPTRRGTICLPFHQQLFGAPLAASDCHGRLLALGLLSIGNSIGPIQLHHTA